jgi:hypothetical protein
LNSLDLKLTEAPVLAIMLSFTHALL